MLAASMTGRATPSARLQPAFTSESPAAERLAACKAYLAAESERIYQRHRADWETYHTRYVAPDRLAGALRSAGPATR